MITKALRFDAEELSRFVNSAYRGESSKQGWTTEADLLDGQRIDPAMIGEMLSSSQSAIWIEFQQMRIQSCVYLSIKPSVLDKNINCLYLGLLTVRPDIQNRGLGKKMLSWSEIQAKSLGLSSIEMTVITQRTELIQWYIKHGYAKTNHMMAFPVGPQFGVSKTQLEMVVLKKNFK
jgi:GNAT superfamily N-acetyltransferase